MYVGPHATSLETTIFFETTQNHHQNYSELF